MFGNDLCLLVSDDNQIPIVVVRLINEIENKGKRDFLAVFVLALIHYIVDIFLFFCSTHYFSPTQVYFKKVFIGSLPVLRKLSS